MVPLPGGPVDLHAAVDAIDMCAVRIERESDFVRLVELGTARIGRRPPEAPSRRGAKSRLDYLRPLRLGHSSTPSSSFSSTSSSSCSTARILEPAGGASPSSKEISVRA